jgi:endoribonuclease Dicer
MPPRTESSQAIQNADISGATNEDIQNDSDDGDEDNDNDDDDEVRPPTKEKKVSERKRRMFAIAEQYISGREAKAAEKDNVVKPEDEAHQSIRWLVKQSENREIISSPREYQTELFERAKEKNIIAVLDTGTSRETNIFTVANFDRYRQDPHCCPASPAYFCSRA